MSYSSAVTNIQMLTKDLMGIVLYSFPKAAVTKYRKLGGLNKQKLIILKFWRLEVQDKGVSRAGSFRGLCGRIC